jgi:hypothetical protein
MAEYRGRINELAEERIAIVSCVIWAGVTGPQYQYRLQDLIALNDKIWPLRSARATINEWLCFNGGTGHTACANPAKPPEELAGLHYEMCRHLKSMEDALFSCENEARSVAAYRNIPITQADHLVQLSSSLEQFEKEAGYFEELLFYIMDTYLN